MGDNPTREEVTVGKRFKAGTGKLIFRHGEEFERGCRKKKDYPSLVCCVDLGMLSLSEVSLGGMAFVFEGKMEKDS